MDDETDTEYTSETSSSGRSKKKLPREEVIDKYRSGKSANDISEDYNVSHSTILRRLNDWNIERRGASFYNRVEYANFKTMSHGYEVWKTRDGTGTRSMLVHRLLAVSEFGFDEVKDNEVHHKNEIPWDNRTENLSIMSTKEHTQHHMTGHNHNKHWKDLERDENGRFK